MKHNFIHCIGGNEQIFTGEAYLPCCLIVHFPCTLFDHFQPHLNFQVPNEQVMSPNNHAQKDCSYYILLNKSILSHFLSPMVSCNHATWGFL